VLKYSIPKMQIYFRQNSHKRTVKIRQIVLFAHLKRKAAYLNYKKAPVNLLHLNLVTDF
jgi:hypothetical protein